MSNQNKQNKQSKLSKLSKNPLQELDWIGSSEFDNTEQSVIPTTPQVEKKTTESGLQDEYMRATFILKIDSLIKFHNLAYTERLGINEAVNIMFEQFLDGKEVIEKYNRDNFKVKKKG